MQFDPLALRGLTAQGMGAPEHPGPHRRGDHIGLAPPTWEGQGKCIWRDARGWATTWLPSGEKDATDHTQFAKRMRNTKHTKAPHHGTNAIEHLGGTVRACHLRMRLTWLPLPPALAQRPMSPSPDRQGAGAHPPAHTCASAMSPGSRVAGRSRREHPPKSTLQNRAQANLPADEVLRADRAKLARASTPLAPPLPAAHKQIALIAAKSTGELLQSWSRPSPTQARYLALCPAKRRRG